MYHNPVRIIETDDWHSVVINNIKILNIERPLIVTSAGAQSRNDLAHLLNGYQFFSDIENNPSFESCQRAIDFSKKTDYDGMIAIGGGSVMDTAKVMIAARYTKISNLKKLLAFNGNYDKIFPKIFIPTTHGTASEVTMWGTIWNKSEKQKYSLANPALYPEIAILDPKLCLSMDLELSISTTLDALSHSFETLWNINSNPRSVVYAIEAIKTILEEVPNLKSDPNDFNNRKRLLRASNLAGLAFSNTKTAAAHSISYPLTFSFGIPHGIACSIPILPLLDINRDSIAENLNLLLGSLKIDFEELKTHIEQIPDGVIDFKLSSWGIKPEDLDEIVDRAFTNSRISNNVIGLSKEDVYNLLRGVM